MMHSDVYYYELSIDIYCCVKDFFINIGFNGYLSDFELIKNYKDSYFL